jgi:hypothetical protein
MKVPEGAKRLLSTTKPAGQGCDLRVCGGQGRGRTADLPIFSRTLVPTELPGLAVKMVERARMSDPDRARTGDLRRDRAAR